MPLKRFELGDATAASTTFLDKLVLAIRKAMPGALLNALGTLTANQTVDLSAADLTTVTLGANLTLTLSAGSARPGTLAMLELAQDGTGARTIALSGATTTGWTMTATSNKKDLLVFIRTATTWIGSVHLQNY